MLAMNEIVQVVKLSLCFVAYYYAGIPIPLVCSLVYLAIIDICNFRLKYSTPVSIENIRSLRQESFMNFKLDHSPNHDLATTVKKLGDLVDMSQQLLNMITASILTAYKVKTGYTPIAN